MIDVKQIKSDRKLLAVASLCTLAGLGLIAYAIYFVLAKVLNWFIPPTL